VFAANSFADMMRCFCRSFTSEVSGYDFLLIWEVFCEFWQDGMFVCIYLELVVPW
jgi:hypothetical protein